MMEIDDNEENAVKTAVKRQSGADGRFFAILTSIPDVMHRIKDMLIQPEKQQSDRCDIFVISTNFHYLVLKWWVLDKT